MQTVCICVCISNPVDAVSVLFWRVLLVGKSLPNPTHKYRDVETYKSVHFIMGFCYDIFAY